MTISELQTGSLVERLQRFVLRSVATSAGDIEFRQVGPAVGDATLVLAHGIGSGSASWLMQLEAAQRKPGVRLIAWEAPGYGRSSPVMPENSDAGDYAGRLWAWLDALKIDHPVTLVGHSLGALMLARAALQQPARVARLVLLAPAQGYARASAQDRAAKLADRLTTLNTLGLAGMAQKRGAAMLSPEADPELVRYVQAVMAGLHPAGYAQAVHLLVGGDLLTDLVQLRCPVVVASGQLDTITPPEGCQKVATTAGVRWTDLGQAGHACALDAPDRVSALLGLSGPKQEDQT